MSGSLLVRRRVAGALVACLVVCLVVWAWVARADVGIEFGSAAGGGLTSGSTTVTGGTDTDVCFVDGTVINCANDGFQYVKGAAGVNGIKVTRGATGVAATVEVVGTDAAGHLIIRGKGNSRVILGNGLFDALDFSSNTFTLQAYNSDLVIKGESAGGGSGTIFLVPGATPKLVQLGVTAASPVSYFVRGAGGSGTDKVGGAVRLSGGISTGAGSPGSLVLQGTPVGATGTTAQTPADVERLVASSAVPVVSACGTDPSAVVGNNGFGRVTTGSGGTVQSCTLTFALPAFASFTSCSCNDETAILLVRATSTTTTLVCDSAVAGTLASQVLSYQCRGL